MPARTNAFQRLITFLEGQLCPAGATVTPSAMVPPTDGSRPKEVDILIEHAVGPHPVRIAIECRAHRRRQGVEWIESLVGKYQHLPVHKIIAVSRSGFTRSAVAAADHAKIATITVEQALSADWLTAVSRYRVGLITWTYPPEAFEINYKDGPKLDISKEDLLAAPIEDLQGNRLGTFLDDMKHLWTTYAEGDVRKWSREEARLILTEPPGFVWHVRIPYHANNRFLVSPAGPRRQINDVILCLACSYRLDPAPLEYFRYHDSIVGTGTVSPVNTDNRFAFTLLFGPDGAPKSLNLHTEKD